MTRNPTEKSQTVSCQLIRTDDLPFFKNSKKSMYHYHLVIKQNQGAQWLSGRVLDSKPRGHGFEPHWRQCVVVLEQDTFILA